MSVVIVDCPGNVYVLFIKDSNYVNLQICAFVFLCLCACWRVWMRVYMTWRERRVEVDLAGIAGAGCVSRIKPVCSPVIRNSAEVIPSGT